MRLREPYVRKHVCQYPVPVMQYVDHNKLVVERTCEGCDKVQCAIFTTMPPLPPELIPYIDGTWLDTTLYDYVNR